MERTPFERKKDFAQKYSLSVAEVQNVFQHSWSIEIFEKMIQTYEAKLVYNW